MSDRDVGNVDLPYFDRITERLTQGEATLETLVGRNVHWGYWPDPARAALTAEDFRSASDSLTSKLLSWADIRSGHTIVDVGCGFGGTIALINETLSGVSLTGVNIDSRQLERARREVTPRPGNKIQFIEGNACHLPLGDKSFDAVLAVECIFHFPSRLQFFEHAYRVLRPGGRLVLCDFTYRPWGLPLIGALFLWNRRDILAVYGRGNSLESLGGYRRLARKTGFQLTGIEDITKGTLPTYAVLRKFADSVGFSSRQFIRAQAVNEWASKCGAMRYEILAFQKPGT